MKIFCSENTVDYGSYTFSYAIYAMREGAESLSPIYEKGFLPYTGDISLKKELFYLARSLRVDLGRFEDTSENRRVDRQIAELNIDMEVIPKDQFDLQNTDFRNFCESYIMERIGEDNMSLDRWNYILQSTVGTHIIRFSNSNGTLGYILAAMNEEMLHYWFAFFDTDYMKSHSLGKWMMWKAIRWAADQNLKYVYLGTAYKPAALYKIRDHKGLEYWDGTRWNSDVNLLKNLCKTDLDPKTADFFKTMSEPNEFLNAL